MTKKTHTQRAHTSTANNKVEINKSSLLYQIISKRTFFTTLNEKS